MRPQRVLENISGFLGRPLYVCRGSKWESIYRCSPFAKPDRRVRIKVAQKVGLSKRNPHRIQAAL
jgi:hypothetical protein